LKGVEETQIKGIHVASRWMSDTGHVSVQPFKATKGLGAAAVNSMGLAREAGKYPVYLNV
jgi:hypothetical protein